MWPQADSSDLEFTVGGKCKAMVDGGLSKLWPLFGSPKLGPVLGPVL